VHSLTQRGQVERERTARVARTTPPAHAVLALQRSAGNRAVTNLLQREPDDEPPILFEVFMSSAAPDDVKFATKIGKEDAARLEAAGVVSEEDRREINGKLKFFKGAGKDAYLKLVKPALAAATKSGRERVRNSRNEDIIGSLADIKDLKRDRINAWQTQVHAKAPKPAWASILEIVIPIVALGFGGVVDAVVEDLLKDKLGHLKTAFVALSALEAGTMATDELLRAAVLSTRSDYRAGVKQSLADTKKQAAFALTVNGDLADVYCEAMRQQASDENRAQRTTFNAGSPAMTDEALIAKRAALDATYDLLKHDPSAFMLELTTGFIRLMDEAKFAESDKEHGGDRKRTWAEDPELSQTGWRAGNLVLIPSASGHSLGDWSHPNLGFKEFAASAIGLSDKALANLIHAPVKDLPVTLGFRFKATDSYGRGAAEVRFVRTPGNQIIVEPGVSNSPYEYLGREWLADFHAGRRHPAGAQVDNAAQLGAKQLYEQLMNLPIGRIGD
jgi:hypothetical protein